LKLIDSLIILGFDENDLWIAAIAYQHNLIVVSADSDFQRIQQVKTLSVDSWV
jgi:tRNA(fMet)-specific endonuclease VapC